MGVRDILHSNRRFGKSTTRRKFHQVPVAFRDSEILFKINVTNHVGIYNLLKQRCTHSVFLLLLRTAINYRQTFLFPNIFLTRLIHSIWYHPQKNIKCPSGIFICPLIPFPRLNLLLSLWLNWITCYRIDTIQVPLRSSYLAMNHVHTFTNLPQTLLCLWQFQFDIRPHERLLLLLYIPVLADDLQSSAASLY